MNVLPSICLADIAQRVKGLICPTGIIQNYLLRRSVANSVTHPVAMIAGATSLFPVGRYI